MTHVNGVIAKLLSKGLMQFEFAHDLLWEYMQQATPVQMQVGAVGANMPHVHVSFLSCVVESKLRASVERSFVGTETSARG